MNLSFLKTVRNGETSIIKIVRKVGRHSLMTLSNLKCP